MFNLAASCFCSVAPDSRWVRSYFDWLLTNQIGAFWIWAVSPPCAVSLHLLQGDFASSCLTPLVKKDLTFFFFNPLFTRCSSSFQKFQIVCFVAGTGNNSRRYLVPTRVWQPERWRWLCSQPPVGSSVWSAAAPDLRSNRCDLVEIEKDWHQKREATCFDGFTFLCCGCFGSALHRRFCCEERSNYYSNHL